MNIHYKKRCPENKSNLGFKNKIRKIRIYTKTIKEERNGGIKNDQRTYGI